MKRSNKFKKRVFVFLLSIIVMLTASVGYVSASIGKTVEQFAYADAKIIAAEYINDIVYDYLQGDEVNYFDIVNLEKSEDNRVSAVVIDSVKLNRIKSEISKEIIDKFSEIEKQQYGIPIGTALNSRLFSGRGFNIYIKIIPLGAFTSSIENEFVSVGINQSLHSIYLNFNAVITVTAPFSQASVSVTDSICISETVILGEVPNTYVQIKGADGKEYIKYFSGE